MGLIHPRPEPEDVTAHDWALNHPPETAPAFQEIDFPGFHSTDHPVFPFSSANVRPVIQTSPMWVLRIIDLLDLAELPARESHINDTDDNPRDKAGKLHLKHCHACDSVEVFVSGYGHVGLCASCGWSEMQTLDLTPTELRLYESMCALREEMMEMAVARMKSEERLP